MPLFPELCLEPVLIDPLSTGYWDTAPYRFRFLGIGILVEEVTEVDYGCTLLEALLSVSRSLSENLETLFPNFLPSYFF